MEHTMSAQVFPDIAGIEIPGAKMGRSSMGKAEYRHFDILTYLNLGRIALSGGAYGKCRLNDAERDTDRKSVV